MYKKLFCLLLAVTMLLSGCCLSHEWQDATCENPKTCAKCEKTEGEALGHNWQEATCETAKTCSVCAKTDGDPLGHQVFWTLLEDRENMSGTCDACQQSFEEALDWDKLAPCFIQGKWEAYGAPEGTYLNIDADGNVEFNRGDKVISMTWVYNYTDEGLFGENAVYTFSSDEMTFDVVTVGKLGDVIMFPIDDNIWSMAKA